MVMRLRREKVIAGVYARTQNERFGSPCPSTASETRLMNRNARTGTTVSATTSEASSVRTSRSARTGGKLADEPADEAEREEHADGRQRGGRDGRRHLATAVEDGREAVLPMDLWR